MTNPRLRLAKGLHRPAVGLRGLRMHLKRKATSLPTGYDGIEIQAERYVTFKHATPGRADRQRLWLKNTNPTRPWAITPGGDFELPEDAVIYPGEVAGLLWMPDRKKWAVDSLPVSLDGGRFVYSGAGGYAGLVLFDNHTPVLWDAGQPVLWDEIRAD